MKKVTCGVTTYNSSETIIRCLSSIENLEYDYFEVIIVDDCSVDNTVDLIHDFILNSSCDIRVLINERNMGVSHSRNRIIKHALGDFIAYFDDDDVTEIDRLSIQLDSVKKDPQNLISFGDRYFINGDKKIYVNGLCYLNSNGKTAARDILLGSSYNHGSGATCCLLAKTSIFKKLNGFDENLKRHEDTEFVVRAALMGYSFVNTIKPVLSQYKTVSSDKTNLIEYSEYLKFIQKLPILFTKKEKKYLIDLIKIRLFLSEKKYVFFLLYITKVFISNPLLALYKLLRNINK